MPPAGAVLTFLCGVVLLLVGVVPATAGRMARLRSLVPLPVVESAHFLGSVIGVLLLLPAAGLRLRLAAAYVLSLVLLAAGMLTALLQGLAYETAALLGGVLLLLLPARRCFYRQAALFAEPPGARRLAAVAMVLLGAAWLGCFAAKPAAYHGAWWGACAFSAHSPRVPRAMAGALLTVVVLLGLRLLRPAAPRAGQLSAAVEQERVRAIVRRSPSSSANLALLGDKRFLFDATEQSFIMYAVAGRSWVAMGDPVGARECRPELIRQYRALCDRHGGWPVFYEVAGENLPDYLELGLVSLKIGEEARVSVPEFALEGSAGKGFRHICNSFARAGLSFEIVAADRVDALLPRLKTISDAWLAAKNCREKRFSLGCFNPDYLRHFPFGVVRRETELVAFCNLWQGAEREELAVDLMRYLPSAPRDTMEFLLLQLLLWAKAQGFRWFNLGMAPLAGLDSRPWDSAWQRLGSLIYRHGEHFYNFQGLRRYKQKFNPRWQPRYLVCPHGLALPRVLADLAALVAGGVKGVIGK